MNNKAISFLKNFSYSLFSNLVTLLVSILITLIIPKLIGVEEYGYWQLYLFYSAYVGFAHFGWNDGIYLRYGGKKYEELNKQLFFSQFYTLFGFQLFIAGIVFVYSSIFLTDIDKLFVYQMLALAIVLTNTRFLLLYILQATNKIKEYAKIVILDRSICIFLIILFLLIGIEKYEFIILADIIGKAISLIYAMYYCKDIVFRKISTLKLNFYESVQNIKTGIKLMFANISSMLIIGVVRFGIERSWDIATFGKVSLTLSISQLMMIFVNAVGVIMFPLLRRTDEQKISSLYLIMKNLLLPILLSILIFYYPIKILISMWLPNYSESLKYMAFLLPMLVFEGKMALLINTYLKTLRKENLMLKINTVTMLLSVGTTLITTQYFQNLDLAVLSIIVLLGFRSIITELFLGKILNIALSRSIMEEFLMIIVFILTAWNIDSWNTTGLYTITFIVYLVFNHRNIFSSLKSIGTLIQKS